MTLLSELKRRRVLYTAAVYAVVALGAVEGADVVVDRIGLPDVVATAVVIAALIGFPVALALSWLFEVRLEQSAGAERTAPVDDVGSSGRSRDLIAVGVVGVLLAAGAGVWAWSRVTQPDPAPLGASQPVTHVLWADDNPENNAAVTLRLRDLGVGVTTALSTAEALERYDPALHQLVVSDMGRYEGDDGSYLGRAGLDLLAQLKERHEDVQLLFCTSFRAVAEYRDEALAAGALGIVANCEEVLTLIRP